MGDGGGREPLAPVIPLFGDRDAGAPPAVRERSPGAAASEQPEPTWHASWLDDEDRDEGAAADDCHDECAEIERGIAERNLLKKLRTRSLSVREARAVVAERDLEDAAIQRVLDDFVRRGYLDDVRLAEQLIHSAVERKGQGRQVIARTLAQRGISRDVADRAVAELPDDDADRAYEFARTKARSLRHLDHDVALRRLVGQLARRGYGSQALDAARRALEEAGREG